MKCYRLIEAESDGLVITESDLYGFDRRQLLLGKWVEGWDSRFTLWYSEGKAEDYLTNMVYWPIASRGMCDVLYSIAPNQIQFLPLNIVHKPTGETLQDYSGVSETVKAVLEVGGFTGCGFREVPVF